MTRTATLSLAFIAATLALGQVREKRVVPFPEPDRVQFERQRRAGVAILVGVGKYPRFSGFGELQFPAFDVDQLAVELEKQNYLVVKLKQDEAMRQTVLNAIGQSAAALAGTGGSMIFFFSGHGFEDHGANYLALYDSASNRLAESGLAVTAVEAEMKKAGVSRRILWIDACRSDPSQKGGDSRSFAKFAAAAGTRILFSTSAGNVSYEDNDLQHGLFTAALLDGLKGAAAGPDGLISFRDLTDYVADGVAAHSLKRGRAQVPYEAGESSGDFLIAKAYAPAQLPGVPLTAPAPNVVMSTQQFGQLALKASELNDRLTAAERATRNSTGLPLDLKAAWNNMNKVLDEAAEAMRQHDTAAYSDAVRRARESMAAVEQGLIKQ
jgi:hypothetical protein